MDNERTTVEIAVELIECARAWEPAARLLGNVCAADVGRFAKDLLAAQARIRELEEENRELDLQVSLFESDFTVGDIVRVDDLFGEVVGYDPDIAWLRLADGTEIGVRKSNAVRVPR